MAEVEIIEESLADTDERLPIQFHQSKRLVCIEYPGYIKNISKALTTLGGEKTVDTVLKDPYRRVGVHFRPKDPFSKQAFGNRFEVTDVLMKVKRKKRKKRNGVENEDVQYECELLGVIDTMVKFKGLADFQYLAPDIPDLLKEIHGSEVLEIDTPLHLPPPVFARIDHAHVYQYRPEPPPKQGDKEASNDRCIGTRTRKRRSNNALSCGFNNPGAVPQAPVEGALKELRRYNNDGLDIVQRLFNMRPMWSRRAIMYHLGKKASRVRLLLPCVGYYWIGGPWRTLWTKFGYDPRKNPAAKIYQKLDYRLRANKTLRGLKLPPAIRSVYDFSLHTGVQKTQPKTVVPTGIDSNSNESAAATEESAANFEDPEVLPYVFHPDRLPPARQVIYQLCDIHCAEAQRLISANDGEEAECHIYDGWLISGSVEKIRRVMTDCLVALCGKQKAAADQETAGSTSQTASAEQSTGDIEDEEARFLDTLMEDDDVEAYDILDDEFDLEGEG